MRPSRLSGLLGVLALVIAGCEGDGAPLSPGPDDDAKAGLESSTPILERQVDPPSDPPAIWIDDLGTGLNQSDDDCDFVEIGFTFYFYGQAYTEIYVNSNGTVSFVNCNSSYSAAIPDGPKILIAPLYGDFNPSVNGDVYFNVVGTPGNRTFLATWYDVPEYSPNQDTNSTFQVQLREGSNTIIFGYNSLHTDGINWTTGPDQNSTMEVGLTSGTGSFVRAVEGTDIPALQGTNLCFTPSGGGDYSELGCAGEVDGAVAVGFRGVMAPEAGQVNVGSSALLTTAVLNTSFADNDPFDFDPATLTASSLVLGPDLAPTAHDLTDAATRELHRADVDGDGDLDLVLHVRGDRTGLGLRDHLLCFRGTTGAGEDVAGCAGVQAYYQPSGPGGFQTPIRGQLYELSLEIGAADCEGSSSWEVYLNGQLVATEPVTGACTCGAEPQVLDLSGTAGPVWNAYGSNTLSLVPVDATAGNDIAIGYARAVISTERSYVEPPVFDAIGAGAQTRDLCLGFAWDETEPVISLTTR